MNKYINLFNSIINDNEQDTDISTTCLINNNSLLDNHIILECNHKFNYIPLYNEVVYQKTRKILDNSKLKTNEIKCPYCRHITTKLLPYYKYYGVRQIKGVNYPFNYNMITNECEYIYKKTNTRCNETACVTKLGTFCNKHTKFLQEDEDIIFPLDNEKFNYYNKKTVKELKDLLKLNHCKLCGNKVDLIYRILICKTKSAEWFEKE